MPTEISMISLEQEISLPPQTLRWCPIPLRRGWKHLIVDCKSMVGPLLTFPNIASHWGPAYHGWPTYLLSAPVHPQNLCTCWAFSADGGMADFSPLGSDLCSLSGAPLTTLAGGVAPHCHSFLSNHLTVEALKSQPAPGLVCMCRCLFISAGTWSLVQHCTYPRRWKCTSIACSVAVN